MQVCAERRTNPASTDRGTTRDNVGNLTTMHLFLAQTIAALRMALLCSTAIGLTLLLATSARAQQQLGPDLPFQWYEDHTAAADLDAFLKLPPEALTWAERPVSLGYTRSALWIKTFIPSTRLATTGNWLSVGPAFIDDITLYVRPHGTEGDWQRKDSGDLWPGSRSELDYRIPTFALPDLEPGSAGLDLIIRAESSSALLIRASVLDDLGLLEHTTRSTGFWSFYFGLAAISLCLAILLAIAINQRFLWAICAFSLTYVLVACIEGFVSWMMAPGCPTFSTT
ncbi:7TMR-DISMED2 domain-containing protein [Neopusillimonas aromaticivorans]|uniref:7TMR-DISMED2 domain-containing protein n=1 Tax=Neopusillimonas aromaticivorans TaxID=2979868 RepID=UPI0025999EF5|nr:7TM-DISM domain-containing protein [Neopusillimonas aromaticivorans]WJJ94078.1 7TM-DISM domain-containing protein [Neopusillimonas aromaticivorans]